MAAWASIRWGETCGRDKRKSWALPSRSSSWEGRGMMAGCDAIHHVMGSSAQRPCPRPTAFASDGIGEGGREGGQIDVCLRCSLRVSLHRVASFLHYHRFSGGGGGGGCCYKYQIFCCMVAAALLSVCLSAYMHRRYLDLYLLVPPHKNTVMFPVIQRLSCPSRPLSFFAVRLSFRVQLLLLLPWPGPLLQARVIPIFENQSRRHIESILESHITVV